MRVWPTVLCLGLTCAMAPAAPSAFRGLADETREQAARTGGQNPRTPQTRLAPGPVRQLPILEFKELPEETTVSTPSGATFTVSRGWHLARQDGLIVIEEPQRELAAAFVEVTAPGIEDAIAQAWKRWKPDFARTVRVTAKPPPTGGWDEIAQISYQTTAEERRVVSAVARRKGTTYYVTLIEGAVAAAERRGAQLNTSIAGLDVPGRREENLAGRKAHTLDPLRIEKFLAFAEEARQQTRVPGVALRRYPGRQDLGGERSGRSRARQAGPG